MQLTGEVGTGKTTIVRSLLAQTPKNAEIALILNPRMTAPEFLLTICEEVGIGVPDSATESLKDLVDILSQYLLRAHAAGRRVVLVVDEAQNLAPAVLEQVRLLTNLETNTQKLLQIILIGQPELRELLGAQRAAPAGAAHHRALSPQSAVTEETTAYVRHRLRVAGATADIFSRCALERDLSAVGRRAAGDQRHLRPGAARRTTRWTATVSPGPWCATRPPKCSASASRLRGCPGPGRRPWPQSWPSAASRSGACGLGRARCLHRGHLTCPRSPRAPARDGRAGGLAAKDGHCDGPARSTRDRSQKHLDVGKCHTRAADGRIAGRAAHQGPGDTTTDAAFSTLFKLWGIHYTMDGTDPCTQATQHGPGMSHRARLSRAVASLQPARRSCS